MLDLADRQGLRWLAAVVADVRETSPGVDLLLVAFAVPDWGTFEALQGRLVESGRFRQLTGFTHKLQHHSGIRIDLIPFGGVERSDGSIAWPPEYAEVMCWPKSRMPMGPCVWWVK